MDIQKEIEFKDLNPHRADINTAMNVLRMIVAETMDYPPHRPHSNDSYLPPHLIAAAQRALAYFDLDMTASRAFEPEQI